MNRRERLTSFYTDRLSYIDIGDASDSDDITTKCLFSLYSRDSKCSKYFIDFSFPFDSLIIENNDFLSLTKRSFIYPTDTESTDKIIISKISNLHTKRFIRIIWCRLYCLFYQIKYRKYISMFSRIFKILHIIKSISSFGTAINNRKICLFVSSTKGKEKIEQLVDYSDRSCCFLIYLIDYNNRIETELQRFFEHKFGLWHRSFIGIDQKQDTIDHFQDSLHFTSEISMSRSINDIDNISFIID